jgi:integrase
MSIRVRRSKVPKLNGDGEYNVRYLILEDNEPMFEVNRYLDRVSSNSYLTGKQYSFVLATYLKFLKHVGIHYKNVTNSTVIDHYIKTLLGYSGETAVINIKSDRSRDTILFHLSVIKNFYVFLEDERSVQINPLTSGVKTQKRNNTRMRNKFLYGQVWDFQAEKSIYASAIYTKESRDYVKWYSQNQIQQFIKQLPTLRDVAVFWISVATGMRIGEILGLRLEHVDRFVNELQVRKRNNTENDARAKTTEREIPVPKEVIAIIEDYLRSEREEADIYYSDYLFINLFGKHKGRAYRPYQFLRVLKRTAGRMGMDSSKIRTHSGRSTRTQQLLNDAKEGLITEQAILDVMGWSSSASLTPYRDKSNSKELIRTADRLREKGPTEWQK